VNRVGKLAINRSSVALGQVANLIQFQIRRFSHSIPGAKGIADHFTDRAYDQGYEQHGQDAWQESMLTLTPFHVSQHAPKTD
jgi:hypothetical protein